MKAIATLAAVLTAAAAVVATAGAPEKSGPGPEPRVITPPARAVSGPPSLGRATASAPATNAAVPRVHLTGPAEVAEFDVFEYVMSVSNDGDADLPGPFTVVFEGSQAFDSGTVTGTGWSCSLVTHTCEWQGDLPPGVTTDPAVFATVATPPFGDPGACPERFPCMYMRAWVSTDLDSEAALGTAVGIGGHWPPDARDDFVWMPTPVAAMVVDAAANDVGETQVIISDIVSFPAHGTAVILGGNTIRYTPGPTFSGTDSFRYRATDINGSDIATVHVGTLTGGIAFSDALSDIGQVEIGRVALRASFVENTTGVELFGHVTITAVDPAEIPGILAGTGYDPDRAVFDRTVFLPQDGSGLNVLAGGSSVLSRVRPNAPLGTVWIARLRLTMSPQGSPTVLFTGETVLVARSAEDNEVPAHANDDGPQTVPAGVPTILHPLVNDDAIAGDLAVTGLSSGPWFGDDGEPSIAGTLEFTEDMRGVLYTPPPGFEGPTRFYYLMSAIVNGFWTRYDAARFDLIVGAPPPPPPVAVATGSATICAGGSAPLTGSGGLSCSWSPATGLSDPSSCTPTASPASTTMYTLTVVDEHGQSSTNNPTVMITVDLPIAVANGTATITLGQSTPLLGTGGASCSWSPATGLDNASLCAPVASPLVTTIYSLVVTSTAGCLSTNPATATITVLQGGPADLVTLLVIPPLNADAGDSIQVAFATRNAGVNLAGASTTRLYLSRNTVLDTADVAIGDDRVPALAGGQIRLDTASVTIPGAMRPGSYYVIGLADADGEVAETNESNNARASLWRIRVR